MRKKACYSGRKKRYTIKNIIAVQNRNVVLLGKTCPGTDRANNEAAASKKSVSVLGLCLKPHNGADRSRESVPFLGGGGFDEKS